ncbi:MAG TPA: thiopeptide-type bacteriocin biosynthesis protein [Mycobacteriales bacterium]|nr:thiopeptide-type bacteriocin biosynthesis protein [Mycobacteriales bacterium]
MTRLRPTGGASRLDADAPAERSHGPAPQSPAPRAPAPSAPAPRAAVDADWLQYDIEVQHPGPELYASLGGALRELLADGTVLDAFFVHKEPGLRLRVRATAAARTNVAINCRRLLTAVNLAGLADGWASAVYEPEQRLFGGPVSMRSVHRIFTADSLAWLGFHALPRQAGATSMSTASIWAMSLLMVRSLLDALHIVGWEDVDVFDRIGRDGSQELVDADAADEAQVRHLGHALLAGWDKPEQLRSVLPAGAEALLAEYDRAVRAEAGRWRADYFTAPGARVSPRQAVARAVLLHWNRARLPAHHQALIVDLLAGSQDDS